MDGVHDMGGMHGFGPVQHEANEPVFHEPWEGRLYGMNAAITPPLFPNIDASRHSLEVLPPAEYLAASYYERWLMRAERRLVELGHISQQELAERVAFYRATPDAPVPDRANAASLERARSRFSRPSAPLHRPDGAPPHFKVGDAVRTKNMHPRGHTRLPGYARGKRGTVARVHGSHDFPDTLAHGLGAQPQGLYSICFEAQELWGESAEGQQRVYIDLWDAYLEPADG
ncbi:MAG: nitrile hydratase subunit beta [Chloroflexota bacterium]|jgi:nitrile hydratase|nr:nitrile hydratase subunit beta [Chloroflexota bacterium]